MAWLQGRNVGGSTHIDEDVGAIHVAGCCARRGDFRSSVMVLFGLMEYCRGQSIRETQKEKSFVRIWW